MSFLEGIFTPRTALPRAPTADELAERDLGPRHAASARARNPYEPSPDVGLSPGHAADALARVARARGRGGGVERGEALARAAEDAREEGI